MDGPLSAATQQRRNQGYCRSCPYCQKEPSHPDQFIGKMFGPRAAVLARTAEINQGALSGAHPLAARLVGPAIGGPGDQKAVTLGPKAQHYPSLAAAGLSAAPSASPSIR